MAPPINESNVVTVQDDYERILDTLLDSGYTREKAKAEAQHRSLLLHEELEEHKEAISHHKLTLRSIISFRDIPSLPTVKALGGWDKMTIEEKKSLLWEVGLDSKDYGWKAGVGHHSDGSGRVVYDKFIISNERTDVEWINLRVGGKKVASMAAQLEASGDKEMYRDMARLGGL